MKENKRCEKMANCVQFACSTVMMCAHHSPSHHTLLTLTFPLTILTYLLTHHSHSPSHSLFSLFTSHPPQSHLPTITLPLTLPTHIPHYHPHPPHYHPHPPHYHPHPPHSHPLRSPLRCVSLLQCSPELALSAVKILQVVTGYHKAVAEVIYGISSDQVRCIRCVIPCVNIRTLVIMYFDHWK